MYTEHVDTLGALRFAISDELSRSADKTGLTAETGCQLSLDLVKTLFSGQWDEAIEYERRLRPTPIPTPEQMAVEGFEAGVKTD